MFFWQCYFIGDAKINRKLPTSSEKPPENKKTVHLHSGSPAVMFAEMSFESQEKSQQKEFPAFFTL